MLSAVLLINPKVSYSLLPLFPFPHYHRLPSSLPSVPPIQRRSLTATLSTGSHTDGEPRSPGISRMGRNSGINGHDNSKLPQSTHDQPCCLASANSCSCSERGQVFVAKQRYEAIGTRSNRVLSFDRGEELEVLNVSAGSEWWEVRPLAPPHHHCMWCTG